MDDSGYKRIFKEIEKLPKKNQNQLIDYLYSAPLWLFDKMRIVNLDEEEIFVREDTLVENVYLLVEGTVKAVDYRVLGVEYEFMRIDAFNTFGPMELYLNESYYQTTLAAITKCTFIAIDSDSFNTWLNTDAMVIQKDIKMLLGYLLEQTKKERLFLFLHGTDRFVLVLTRLYAQYENDDVCELKLTIDEYANISGLSRKTLNRAIAALKAKGHITRLGHSIIINQDQFRQMNEYLSDIIY